MLLLETSLNRLQDPNAVVQDYTFTIDDDEGEEDE